MGSEPKEGQIYTQILNIFTFEQLLMRVIMGLVLIQLIIIRQSKIIGLMDSLGIVNFDIKQFSSQDPGHSISHISHGSQQKNTWWQSAPFCTYPQIIILRLHQCTELKSIQFFVHQYKIPTKIMISISQKEEDGWRKLGCTSLSDNLASDYKSRELKTAQLPANSVARFVKLEMVGHYENKQNIFKQVGILFVKIYGKQKILGDVQKKEPQNKQKNKGKFVSNGEGKDSDTLLCVVCMVKSRNCLFSPCNHLVCCYEDCGTKLAECPVCRCKAMPIRVYL